MPRRPSLSLLLSSSRPLGAVTFAGSFCFPLKSDPSATTQAACVAVASSRAASTQATGTVPASALPLRPALLIGCPRTCLYISPRQPSPWTTLSPAPQPHIPSFSLSPPLPRFCLVTECHPWHAATAGAGELHGPQKSQAVSRAARLPGYAWQNKPLMSFQKTMGWG